MTASRLNRATVVVSALIYAAAVGVNLDPHVRETWVRAFGAEVMGLPVTLAVIVTGTLLYLPAPWVFWHLMRISGQALEDGERIIGWRLLAYAAVAGRRHPELRRSAVVVGAGL